jgi:hypothetical protein
VWAVVTGAALRLAYGPGHIGFDAIWSLVWGDEIAHGRLPSYDIAGTPTPHPLANAVATVLSVLGDGAVPALVALSFVAAGALAVGCFLLASRLFSPPVGALFALLVVSRELVLQETIQSVLDIPFLGLIVGAMAVELRRPARGAAVPALLLAAGLLRPEAWLVAAAYAAWSLPGRAGRDRWIAAALLAAAPVIWALTDLAITGDALWSLHGTQDLAADLERPRKVGTALREAPQYLRFAVGDQIVWVGFAGALAALAWRFQRAALPMAVLALGLATFLALGVADLPLLIRYLFLPALMLALFCAFAVFGWVDAEPDRRRLWLIGGVVAGVVVAAFVPTQAGRLADGHEFAQARSTVQRDLHDLIGRPAVRSAAVRCGHVHVPDPRPRPLVAYWLGRDPATVTSRTAARGVRGLVVSYATAAAMANFAIGRVDPPPGPAGIGAGARTVAANRSFVAATVGC